MRRRRRGSLKRPIAYYARMSPLSSELAHAPPAVKRALIAKRTSEARERFVKTKGKEGLPPPVPRNLDLLTLPEACERMQTSAEGLMRMLDDADCRRRRRAHRAVVRLPSLGLSSRRGVLGVRCGCRAGCERCAYYCWLVAVPHREPKPRNDRERVEMHSADLRKLLTFFRDVSRGVPVISSSSSRCPTCRRYPGAGKVVQCRGCGTWISRVPRTIRQEDLVDAADVSAATIERIPIGEPLSQAWGGGLVPGAVVLVAGGAGAGKSSLALPLAVRAAEARNGWSLYANIEQTSEDLRPAIDRLGGAAPGRLLMFRKPWAQIQTFDVEGLPPVCLVLDSVSELVGPRGADAGVAVARRLKQYALRWHVAVIIVCHVEKEGDVAGAAALKHAVDGVFMLDAPTMTKHRRSRDLTRTLRVEKHRYGPTCSLQLEMGEHGLTPAPPPLTDEEIAAIEDPLARAFLQAERAKQRERAQRKEIAAIEADREELLAKLATMARTGPTRAA